MANFYGSSRTNYFRVKDEAAFKAWAERFGFEVITSRAHPGMFGLLPNDCSDDGMFSMYDPDNENDGDEEPDFMTELSKHLAEGSVAVLIAAGAEKLRYVSGWAEAVDHTGTVVAVSLDDIYALAKEKFGIEPTDASY